MSTRMFSDDQLERLRSYPDIGRDDLIRQFPLTPADVAFIDPKYRRPVLGGRVKDRLEELIHAKADEHGRQIVALEVRPDHVHLFGRSSFVATVGAVCADSVQRYIETRYARVPKGGGVRAQVV